MFIRGSPCSKQRYLILSQLGQLVLTEIYFLYNSPLNRSRMQAYHLKRVNSIMYKLMLVIFALLTMSSTSFAVPKVCYGNQDWQTFNNCKKGDIIETSAPQAVCPTSPHHLQTHGLTASVMASKSINEGFAAPLMACKSLMACNHH